MPLGWMADQNGVGSRLDNDNCCLLAGHKLSGSGEEGGGRGDRGVRSLICLRLMTMKDRPVMNEIRFFLFGFFSLVRAAVVHHHSFQTVVTGRQADRLVTSPTA